MTRSGHRVAVVGMITGGLLMLGLSPALADGVIDDQVKDATSQDAVRTPTLTRSGADRTATDRGEDSSTPEVAPQKARVAPREGSRLQLQEVCNSGAIPPDLTEACEDITDVVEPEPGPPPGPDVPEVPEVPDPPAPEPPPCEGLPLPPCEDDGGGDDPGNGNGGGGGDNGGADGGSGGDGTVPGHDAQGGPGNDPVQAQPEGTVPGANVVDAAPQLQACSDPSLCQELDDEQAGAVPAADVSSSMPSAGDGLADAGAPANGWALAAAGAGFLIAGCVLLLSQVRVRGLHRA